MEKQQSIISIAQKIAKIVSSRDLVRNLEKEVSKQPHTVVNLDFSVREPRSLTFHQCTKIILYSDGINLSQK